MSDIPELGWITTGRVYRVMDGDTIQVEVSRLLTIRIRDCWAPETNREDEKERGLAAKKFMQKLADGMTVRVYIPGTPDGDFRDVTSMGRVVGDVWLEGSKKNLAEEMVKAGHATAKKGQKK